MSPLEYLFQVSEYILLRGEVFVNEWWWMLKFCKEYFNLYGRTPPSTWRMAKRAVVQYGYQYKPKEAVKNYEEGA